MRGILPAVLVILLLAPIDHSMGEDPFHGDDEKKTTYDIPLGSFPPTTIDGDAELAAFISDNNFTGNGTEKSPYIIIDLVFDVPGGDDALRIENVAKHLKIINCSFGNFTKYRNSFGIELYDSEYITVEKCDFFNCSGGVYLRRSDNIRIENCEFNKIHQESVSIMDGDNDRIVNSTFEEQQFAILVNSYMYNVNLSIENCRIDDCYRGIQIDKTEDVQIFNTTIDDIEDSGMDLEGKSMKIENCTVRDSGSYSIGGGNILSGSVSNCLLLNGTVGLRNFNNIDVIDCLIDSRWECISMGDSEKPNKSTTIHGNSLISEKWGLYLRTSNCVVTNNSIKAETCGMEIREIYYPFPYEKVIVRNNSFSKCTMRFSGPSNVKSFENNSIDGRDILLVNKTANQTISDSNQYSQIIIHGCTNITIRNMSDLRNIHVNIAEDVMIRDCSVSDSTTGISTYHSLNITILDCNMIRHETCIDPDNTPNLKIVNNDLSESIIGINISYDSDIKLFGNRMSGCSIWFESSGEDMEIPINNTVNGEPILYLNHSSNIDIENSTDFGQIILIQCNKVNITDYEMSDSTCGIIIHNCENIFIESINIRNQTRCGIYSRMTDLYLENSSFENCRMGMYNKFSRVQIFNCEFKNNDRYGLNIQDSFNGEFHIFHNSFEANGLGLNLGNNIYYSFFNIYDNLFAFNREHAIYAYEDSRIFNNAFIENNNLSGQLQKGKSQAAGFYQSFFSEWNGRGNYWSDHNLTDSDNDGETDRKYHLDDIYGTNFDEHPLSYVPQIGAPTDISLIQGNGNVTVRILDWNDTEKLEHSGFRIYRSEDLVNWTHVTDLPLHDTEYTDEDVWNDHTYHYKITCLGKVPGYDWIGEGWRGPILNETPDGKAPQIKFIYPVQGTIMYGESTWVIWNITDNQDRLNYMEISVNGSDWIPYSNDSYLMTNLTNGTYGFGVRAFDEAGNSAEKFISYVIDMDNPIVEILHPNDNSYITENPFLVQWRIEDPTSEIRGRKVEVDGIRQELKMGEDSLLLELPDGPHNIVIEAWDLLVGRTFARVDFVVDTTEPYVSIQNPKTGSVVGPNSFILEFESYDKTSGMDYVLYKMDNDRWLWAESGMEINSSSLENGQHEIELLAADLAGNLAYDHITFKVDRYPPQLTILEPSNGSRINRLMDIKLVWDAEDTESGLSHLWIDVDGRNNLKIETPETGFCYLHLSEAGTHNIEVRLFDLVGNHVSETIEIIIDMVTPFVTSINPVGEGVSTSPTFSIIFSEEMDIERTIMYIQDVECQGYWVGRIYTLTTKKPLDPNTVYELKGEGYDLAGNQLREEKMSFKTWEKGKVWGTVRDRSGDPLQGVYVNVTDENIEVQTGISGLFQFELEPGTYELRFFFENHNPQSIEIEIKPGENTITGDILLERSKKPDDGEENQDGKWIILALIFLMGGLLSVGTFLFVYINKGRDETVELERDDEDYLVERGTDEDEYVKHEGNIERAKNDLW